MNEEQQYKIQMYETLNRHQNKIRNNELLDYQYCGVIEVQYRIGIGMFLQLPYEEGGEQTFLQDVCRIRLQQQDGDSELTVWYHDPMDQMYTIEFPHDELYLLDTVRLCMYQTAY